MYINIRYKINATDTVTKTFEGLLQQADRLSKRKQEVWERQFDKIMENTFKEHGQLTFLISCCYCCCVVLGRS